MKRSGKILGALFALLLVMLVLPGVNAQAASTVSTKVNGAATTKTFRADLTGDGKADTVKIVPYRHQSYGSSLINKLKVTVNGKNVGTIAVNDVQAYTVKYLHLSNSREFLAVRATWCNSIELNAIYRYTGGKLKKVGDLSLYAYMSSEIASVSSSSIKVKYTGLPDETGWLAWTYTYKYKNGKLVKSSTTASVKSDATAQRDGFDRYYKKNKMKTLKSLTFYTTAGGSKKAFTVSKGTWLTLKKIKVTSKAAYLQFATSSGKTGWKKIYTNSNWFYGAALRSGL